MSDLSVSIIIPTLNEEKNLSYVLPRIPTLPQITEVILVDGHSTDDTVRVAQSLMPRIRVVYQEGKGKGDAVKCGARVAATDFFLVLDADGSQSPDEIPLYLEKAKEGYDLVKGSRYLGGNRNTEDETIDRVIIVWLTYLVANTVWRTHFSDIGYGMFLMQRRKFLELDIRADRLELEYELMIKAAKRGFRIAEVPAHEARRIHGKSHLSYFRDGRLIATTVFREALRGKNTK